MTDDIEYLLQQELQNLKPTKTQHSNISLRILKDGTGRWIQTDTGYELWDTSIRRKVADNNGDPIFISAESLKKSMKTVPMSKLSKLSSLGAL